MKTTILLFGLLILTAWQSYADVVCTVVPRQGRVCQENGARHDGLPDRPGRPDPFPGPGRPLPPPPPPYPGPVRPGPRPLPPPVRPLPPPGNPGYGDRIEIPVRRYMNNETMSLNNWVGGSTVLYSVEISHNGYYNSGWLNLMVDRRVDDTEYTGYDNYSILTPRSPVWLGRAGSLVELQVNGSVYVDRIVLMVNRNGQYQPPMPGRGIELQTGFLGNFQGRSNAELYSRLNLAMYSGYRIESVTIFGSSDRGFGQATLLAGGYNRGSVTLPTGYSQQSIYLGNVILGRDIYSLDLNLNGNIWIERVVVRLVR